MTLSPSFFHFNMFSIASEVRELGNCLALVESSGTVYVILKACFATLIFDSLRLSSDLLIYCILESVPGRLNTAFR
jgi:hypothetical protein